jgi:hypothetical protein
MASPTRSITRSGRRFIPGTEGPHFLLDVITRPRISAVARRGPPSRLKHNYMRMGIRSTRATSSDQVSDVPAPVQDPADNVP